MTETQCCRAEVHTRSDYPFLHILVEVVVCKPAFRIIPLELCYRLYLQWDC